MHRPGRLFLCGAALVAFAFPTISFAVSFTVDQCQTCGPADTNGKALQIIISGLNAPTTTAIGLVNTSASYNPATITNISASVEKDSSYSQSTPLTISFSSGFRPLVEQDGNIYILNPAITGTTFGSVTPVTSLTSGWSTISSTTALTLSDFFLYSFATASFETGNPNGTDPVYFGIASISTFNNTGVVNGTSETDFADLNISDGPLLVDSNFSDISNYQVLEYPGTPEPSTLFLLGTGLAALYSRGKSRRKP